MTPEEFLTRQETRTRESLARAASRTGHRLRAVVDLSGIVRRHPSLSLGAGTAIGFVLGSAADSQARRLSHRAFRSMIVPLLRPTVSGLGTALAGFLIGPAPSRP